MSECLKTLGIVSSDTECSGSCRAMEIVEQTWRVKGDGCRATMEQIARRVAAEYCPKTARMVLPKGSRRLVW